MHGDIESQISSLKVVAGHLDQELSSLQFQDLDYDSDISSLSFDKKVIDEPLSGLIFWNQDPSIDQDISSLSYENTGQYDSDISSLQYIDLKTDLDISSLQYISSGFNQDISSLLFEDLSNDQKILSLRDKIHDVQENLTFSQAYWDKHRPSRITFLAERTYDEEIGFLTGDARDIEVSLIRDWMEGHLGELNALIFTSFSGYNPKNFNLEEQAILRELYLSEYNRKAHRRVLRGIDGSNGAPDFQVIKEGDSMIQKSNKNVTAKSYRDAYLDSQERVKELVHAYNLYGARPNQVYGDDAFESGENKNLDEYHN